ncbi:Histidine--tRNA ligase [Alphaproteobacteria bacterium SO-S41]|nr:Histidine--tRNA ligase [Alphaproteobacteria bacterium SO-S41]
MSRLTPRLVKGFKDAGAASLHARRRMIETVRGVYESFGFEALETPAVEYVETLGKFLPESDQPDAGIFALQDGDEQWIALRYDLTAPLSRYVAQNIQALPMPFRRYQIGSVFRNEKPGPGRFREFTQFDVDTVGSASMVADAENCAVLARSLDALGLAGQFRIAMNNRKVLDGVLERAGLGQPDADPQAMTALRAIDKFDKFGVDGVKLLLTTGRKDESGDFTKGAGLSAAQADSILAFMASGQTTRAATCGALADAVKGSARGEEGVRELQEIASLLDAMNLPEAAVAFDPGIVRGLAYYTGPVLEAQVTFEIKDEDGRARQFGSVAGGGRYDGLVGRFLDKELPATGVSIGVDRLIAALEAANRMDSANVHGPVLVVAFDRTRMADYVRIAEELRADGIAAEIFLGEGGMKPQLRYADRKGSPVAIIAGGDEFAAGTVSVKDLILGAEIAASTSSDASHTEWRAAAKARAQVTVPRAELTANVRRMLAGAQK